MIWTKSKPGPRPTSCLTCRKRRKRCDKARPSCERCLKGGYECLGYNNNEPCRNTQPVDPDCNRFALPQFQSVTPSILTPTGSSEVFNSNFGHSPNFLVSKDRPCFGSIGEPDAYDSIASASRSTFLNSITRPNPWANDGDTTAHDIKGTDYNSSWPQSQSQSQSQLTTGCDEHLQLHKLSKAANLHAAFGGHVGESQSNTIVQTLCVAIPPSVDATQIV
ncbi:hypothetical protein B0J17DRAFT_663620, partial [Rhizoctonia solani]